MPTHSRGYNRRTVAGYERCARDYAASVDRVPSPAGANALRQLAAAVAGADHGAVCSSAG